MCRNCKKWGPIDHGNGVNCGHGEAFGDSSRAEEEGIARGLPGTAKKMSSHLVGNKTEAKADSGR
jgi:hypothetical protein